jgi:hypothetical protein
LTNVETAMKRAKATVCRVCGRLGASLKCFKAECAGRDDGFHITCAKRTNGRFIKDKVNFFVGLMQIFAEHPKFSYFRRSKFIHRSSEIYLFCDHPKFAYFHSSFEICIFA